MKKMMLIATMILLVATPLLAQEKREVAREADAIPLRGAWNVTLTPEEGGPPPFQVLILFTRDGGVVETDAGPPNPLQFSPGLGEWTRDDKGQYTIRYTQLQYDGGQNQIGVFRGKIVATIDDAKNLLVGSVRVRFYDLHDVLMFEGNGTIQGTRLQEE